MTNKDFNRRAITVFTLALVFVLFVACVIVGMEYLSVFLFEPTMTDAIDVLDALFDSSLNALKGD